ncbi:lysophospholipase [Actinoplanes sp. OR16]|uniref:alpha/beta hydrolase n=1 Tax=Actinoplanes sp. OR16 TaxID=946334 RepID=UPI000F6D995A|nr:lysophospholipase [Actinoplanes sp. OR16]BBH69547.1 lysophospholipase [Actinoplanes sp. OR16]
MTNAFDEPAGIAPRGTVIVAAGRGETIDAYQRFGKRIAADGYKVRLLPDVVPDLESSFAAAEKLLVDDGLPGPRVIVGSDTGALFALALARRAAPGLDAVVVAGIPLPEAPGVDLIGWEGELEARTGCPAHRGVLAAGAVTPGALFSAQIPTELIGEPGDVTIPTLGLHGADDPISPLASARPAYPGRLVGIAGGRHDILNDVTHRTAAATIILFLERLRLGASLPVIATEVSA